MSWSSLSRRRGMAVLGLVAGFAASATAQTGPGSVRSRPSLSERRGQAPPAEAKPAPTAPAEPARPETKSDGGEPRKDSFLGDTSKFTRYSGWGSMGAAMGQFGVARSMLVMMPPVQKELKLTDEQKKELREIGDAIRKRGEKMGEAMRKQGEDPFRTPNGDGNPDGGNGGEDTSVLARVNQFTGMMTRVTDLMRENDEELNRVLSKAQRKRLDQIALQMEGVMALARPEVGEALGLFPVEQEEIAQIIARSRMTQMTAMVGTMMTMRSAMGARTAPGARPTRNSDQPKPKAEPKEKEQDKDSADGKAAPDSEARAQREKLVRERFQALRTNNDKVQDQAVREILKFLNKSQRARFTQMLGPPFDPNQLTDLGRPPGRGGRPEPEKTPGR